ncbi:LPS export ABC transporter periplasmic protein LptC [Rhizobium halophytocola]|uniref:Lipopolysaccharide export system protein LptC n=1 Tax=Rhizobium halophytocola TaxID=735519 RepID=A0ABS4E016_9HYPH|nr:LPS export ABC transporter periplasmic protein LptC [Rhizobium halophytocola]MBP1851280.1 lipopolysaccharide export system protein LptC [Rhizobium halophytocola]
MLNRVADSAGVLAPGASNTAYRAALRHSARVRRLKILLPLIAVIISLCFVAVSVIRTFLPENLQLEAAHIENGKIVMERPAVSGRNRDGINYSMRAVRALQDIKDPNLITLENITAAVPLNEKSIARVVAESGVYDRSSDRLNMTAPFTIRLSSGLEAKFQSAFLDIKGGEMDTKEPVSITSNEASIVADSLNITDKGQTVTFSGSVRVHIDPATIRNNKG